MSGFQTVNYEHLIERYYHWLEFGLLELIICSSLCLLSRNYLTIKCRVT